MSRNRPGIGGAMYGAIIGDIIGSPFEFDRGTKTKDFELFTKGCQFTDDSVMTVAIAAIHQMYAKDDKNSLLFLLTMLCGRMKSKGHVLVPFVTVGEDMFSDLDVYHLKERDTLTLDHDVRLHMDTVTEGKNLVKSKFLKLNYSHVEYVINCLGKNTTKVRNIKSYLLASLFNAGSTISSYYRAEINHDMPQYAG